MTIAGLKKGRKGEENGGERKTEKGKQEQKERLWVLKSEHHPVGEDSKFLEFVELTPEFYFFS